MGKIRPFLFHPFTNLGMGVVLVLSSLFEMIRQAEDAGLELRAHHGVALYGLVLCTRSLADLVEGTRRTTDAMAEDRAVD